MGMKGLGDRYTEKERLEMTIEHMQDREHNDQVDDKDYMRHDLDEADDEELEDRLVEAARVAQRPLNLDEVSRLSRNKFDGQNLSSSILSGVLSQNDIQVLQRQS